MLSPVDVHSPFMKTESINLAELITENELVGSKIIE